MAHKGETKSQKSLSSENILLLNRKDNTWVSRTRAGAYKKSEGIPIKLVLTNLIKIADFNKEAKRIIALGKLLVNGKVVRNDKLTVGLFDTISFAGHKKAYVLNITNKGKLIAEEVDFTKQITKIVKVKNKFTGKKGKTFISTADGKVIEINKEKVHPGDSIVMTLPEQKISKILPLTKKSQGIITGGKHVGEKITVLEIKKGSMTRDKLIDLKSETGNFETTERYVLVTG